MLTLSEPISGVAGMPVAEALGQATPFAAMLGHKQYGIQYLEVGKTDVASLAWQATLDSCALG